MKEGKYLRAARELQMKQGPAYDRWKVAMEARGEQKRCKECWWIGGGKRNWHCERKGRWRKVVTPGQYACKWFKPWVEG